ncbi:MAG: arginine repressor [Clostridiales bacterium]|jgi:transcriptional regulator of arginine metabolism|nr:arginine repressor [Clostridiales bacterium]
MKVKRHSKIIELISKYDIETQEELAERLAASGFAVTQATVSRDIRQLKLTKVTNQDGRQKYVSPVNEDTSVNDRLIRVFKESVVSMVCARNLLVIKTLAGTAMAVAAALDSMKDAEIMGSIAGDDTIFCALSSERTAARLMERLRNL